VVSVVISTSPRPPRDGSDPGWPKSACRCSARARPRILMAKGKIPNVGNRAAQDKPPPAGLGPFTALESPGPERRPPQGQGQHLGSDCRCQPQHAHLDTMGGRGASRCPA